MIIFRKAAALFTYLKEQRENGLISGFVPTMGALHDGHLSLIDAAKKGNLFVVCSIFVNPAQFNNKDDFATYPVTIEHDIELLEGSGCDVLFLPGAEEIYPKTYDAPYYDLGLLEYLLEGAHRPGHFQGVCRVVDRLLDIVRPDALYIGQKDYQQCLVIKKLLRITDRQITTHVIPTKRDPSGLALSSRNLRLNNEQKNRASVMSQVLQFFKKNLYTTPLPQLLTVATERLESAGFIVDYVAVVNAQTLQPATDINEPLVALIAATLDGVRLIDNEVLNSPSKHL